VRRLIVDGMARQGYRVHLREIDAWASAVPQWSATTGFASAPTPWEALQQAAWVAVKRTRRPMAPPLQGASFLRGSRRRCAAGHVTKQGDGAPTLRVGRPSHPLGAPLSSG
jgi:hypothetical protein